MAQVSFKKGLLANLPAGINAGTVYVTTDERAIYMDLDESTRIRIGDFQEFKTLAALQANTNPSTSALYYVSDLNVLAKWTGTEYVQINLDTGATSAEVTGEGNAITGVSYDAATRKLTFTKATTFITPTEVDTKIGEADKSVRAYVDEKTKGIASDTALTALAGRVTTAEEAIKVINGEETQEGSIKKALADAKADAAEKANAAQAAAEKKATDLNGAMDTRVKAAESDLTTIKGEGAGSIKNALADAKAYADGLAPNYDAKGDANAALEAAKTYTNGLLEWGSF